MLQLKQPDRDELVGHQDVKEPAVQGTEDGLGQAKCPGQFTAERKGIQMIRVQADRHQPDLAGPVPHPADRGTGNRQPLGYLVLGELVLVGEPGDPEQEFRRVRPAHDDGLPRPHAHPFDWQLQERYGNPGSRLLRNPQWPGPRGNTGQTSLT